MEIDSAHAALINNKRFGLVFNVRDTLVAIIAHETDSAYFLDDNYKWQFLETRESPIYKFEDEKYGVNGFCMGEFGGSLTFVDKSTDIHYSTPADCPQSIHKINNSYYITNSSASCFCTQIVEIDNPLLLYRVPDSLKNWINWWVNLKISSSEITDTVWRRNGYEILTEKMLIFTPISFLYKNELYNIHVEESRKTQKRSSYITKLQDTSLVFIDSIGNEDLSSYRSTNMKFGHMYLHSMGKWGSSGFITISNDTIKIITFK